MSTSTAIAGLDHCIIATANLEVAQNTYAHLGFTISKRGRHIGWGTANYCIMFGPDYIELLGIVDPEQYTAGLEDFLKNREGLIKIVSRSDKIETTKKHLQNMHFHPGEIKDLGRILEMPEGDVTPRFKLLHLPESDTADFSTFICQHLTPELVWRDEWMQHENGAKAVYAYTILHDDPHSLADIYNRFYQSIPVIQDQRIIVETGGGKLIFTTVDGLTTLHPGLNWPLTTENGTMAVITIAVEETDICAQLFKERAIPHLRREDGSLLIQPEYAHGAALQFQNIYK